MTSRLSSGLIRFISFAISTVALAGCTSNKEGIQDLMDPRMGSYTGNQKRIEANAIQRAEHQSERHELEANW